MRLTGRRDRRVRGPGAMADRGEVHTARGETGPATRRRRDRTLIWSGRVQVDA